MDPSPPSTTPSADPSQGGPLIPVELRQDLRAALDAHAIVAVTDAQGRISYVNGKFCEISGYTREELLGQDHRIINSGHHPKAFIRDLWDTIRQGRIWKGELRNRAKDGSDYWVDTTIVPFLGPDGTPSQYIAIRADITARKRAEARLLDSLRKLADIRAALDEHAIVAVTDPQGRITFVNDKFCAISGYSREELLGQDHRIINSGHHPKAFIQDLWDTIRAGRVWKGELCNRAKDGSLYWVDTTIVPFLEASGRPHQYVAIRADITERKRAEHLLREAQKHEVLATLAGGIAHDFNNLLTSMMANLELLQLKLSPAAPALPLVRAVQAGAERAAELAQQMLSYSGKGGLVAKPLDLGHLLKELIPKLEKAAGSTPVTLSLDPDLPLVRADAAQISQAVATLVTNAVEATPSGRGAVRVTLSTEQLGATEIQPHPGGWPLAPGPHLRLDVTDQGPGMDPATRDRIFDPFFSTKGPGRGLGLAVLQGVLRGHRAGLSVTSSPGRGSTFSLHFPALPAVAVAPAPAGGGSLEPWKGATVLLVDDEECILAAMGLMLEFLDLRVIQASDGLEAEAMFLAHRTEISLVIMDLTMPRRNGVDTFKALRNLDPRIPIILSSGFHPADLAATLEGRNLSGFLQKPYQLKDLTRLLSTITPP